MKTRWFTVLMAVILLLTAFTGCSGGAAPIATNVPTNVPPPATVAPTRAPATATATAEPPKPTATLILPTATLVPTATQVKPTDVPKPTVAAEPAGLYLVSLSSYKDSFSTFHIVGEIKNNDKRALEGMELTVEARDKAGTSLLKNSDGKVVDTLPIHPELDALAPGETSPFIYTISSEVGVVDKFNVTVTGQKTSSITRPTYEVKNSQIVNSGDGTYHISGEIFNKGSKPMEVSGLVAAMLDKDKKVVSVDFGMEYTSYLKPAGDKAGMDSTPFSLTVEDPGTSPKDYKLYIDAREVDPETDYAMTVKIHSQYFDSYKNYHVVGVVTNNTKEVLTTNVVGGLYDKNGVVLDSCLEFLPVTANPAEVIPFDVSCFDNVDHNADEAARLDTATVQLDPWGTFPSSFVTAPLKSANEKVTKDGPTWNFTGKVTNTSSKVLSSITIIVEVFDKDGVLVGMNWTAVYSKGDSIAASDTLDYSVTVDLSVNKLDQTGYTYKTLVKGDVK